MADTKIVTAEVTAEGVISKSADGKIVTTMDGPSPTDLLLMATAECSGLTLRAVLERDGVKPEKVSITVEGVRKPAHPRQFTDLNMHYEVRCPGLEAKKLERYLKVAEAACPVAQSLSAKIHATYDLT